MSISVRDRKILWARSGNMCAYCGIPLIEPSPAIEKPTIIGVECHIVAQSQGGPRYRSDVPKSQVDSYDNLLLLCANHHKWIDDNPEEFTETILARLKRKHEEKVNSLLAAGENSLRYDAEQRTRWKLEIVKRMKSELVSDDAVPSELGYRVSDKFDFNQVIVHSIDDLSYDALEDQDANVYGYSGWYKAGMWDIYSNGLELIVDGSRGFITQNGEILAAESLVPGAGERPGSVIPDEVAHENLNEVTLFRIGRIPSRNIVEFVAEGDEWYGIPHFYVRYSDEGGPYSHFYWVIARSQQKLGLPLPIQCWETMTPVASG